MSENINVLCVNGGSTSIKIDLLAVGPNNSFTNLLSASVTGIGQDVAILHVVQPENNYEQEMDTSTQARAVNELVNVISARVSDDQIEAVGHRFVHGGPDFDEAQLINERTIEQLHEMAIFDPVHIPVALELITLFRQRLPRAKHIACFDTLFFKDMPKLAKIVPISRKYAEQGVRRYGFHGLSYDYLQTKFAEVAGEQAAKGRVIYAHLGGGASLTATKNLQPMDTTMGFSPSSGVIMSSRSGDLDPTMAGFLNLKTGLSLKDYSDMVNFQSGLLGVSELSSDMYTLIQNETSNYKAAEAVELFVYQIKKAIGSLAAVLNGLDSLVFSGGIGEKSSMLRQRICTDLNYLGIEMDDVRNEQHAELVSSDNSRVGVHVLRTNEAIAMAKQVQNLINKLG